MSAMTATFTPEDFERHVRGMFGAKEIFTAREVATIDEAAIKTVHNAVWGEKIRSVGQGRLRRFKKWDIYEWMTDRRN